jgi:hypothetical protein
LDAITIGEIPDCAKTSKRLSLVFMFYILEDNTPVACTSGPEWQEWIEQAGDRRIVAQDDAGDFLVSTVFQGVDPVVPHSPTPLLFETLIYDRNGQVPLRPEEGLRATGRRIHEQGACLRHRALAPAFAGGRSRPSIFIEGLSPPFG